MTCPICDSDALERALSYEEPPDGETSFGLSPDEYRREYLRCTACGHFVAQLAIDVERLYAGDYVDATYAAGLEASYDRIMALPPERSDNVQRVRRISERLESSGRVLDVGSGLAVFPARMKEAGWGVTALDPDPRAAEHARRVVGIDSVCADFFAVDDLGEFDLVTLNKVIEHVADPLAMLIRARRFLRPGGRVYVEVPDGEAAARDADPSAREEFFIEHLHVFSMASLCLLMQRAGFLVDAVERIREPSDKYTLFAFAGSDPAQ